MKRFFALPFVLVALAFTGCGSLKSTLTPGLVQSGVSSGVRFGVTKYPTAVPAVRVASEVICSAANGTNISPAQIVSFIESSQYENLKTPEAVFIVQGVITIYTTAWNSFGDGVVNDEIKPYLQAVCNGSREGLSGLGAESFVSRSSAGVQQWPRLRFK